MEPGCFDAGIVPIFKVSIAESKMNGTIQCSAQQGWSVHQRSTVLYGVALCVLVECWAQNIDSSICMGWKCEKDRVYCIWRLWAWHLGKSEGRHASAWHASVAIRFAAFQEVSSLRHCELDIWGLTSACFTSIIQFEIFISLKLDFCNIQKGVE